MYKRQVIDPQYGQPSPILGIFKYLLMILVFLGIDGHHLFIKALFKSFEIVPAGAATIPAAWPQIGLGCLLYTSALGILAILTVLTLAPAILILTTSFTRIAIVFSFLRAGMGTQQTPPNQVLIGLALLLTFFIMTPTWGQINEAAVTPYMSGEITAQEAISLGQEPVKEFMLKQTRENDLALFIEMGQAEIPSTPEEMSLTQIVPAFALSLIHILRQLR